MGRRTQAERDATTVEIGFALFVAVGLAGAAFLAVTGPALLLDVSPDTWRTAKRGGALLGAAVFVLTLVVVLVRHSRTVEDWRRREAEDQPSQPGRTSPDS
ncbi:DUF6332 family protein [Actinomycetota bacterium Odt1-20B]